MFLNETTAEPGAEVQIKGRNEKKRAPNEIRSPFAVFVRNEPERIDPLSRRILEVVDVDDFFHTACAECPPQAVGAGRSRSTVAGLAPHHNTIVNVARVD